MSELLSREKEYLKLNEELNVKTKILLEKPHQSKENRQVVNGSARGQTIEATSPRSLSPVGKFGKPPIKPRVIPTKANTIPRSLRQPTSFAVAPIARSTPKGRGRNGSATFRVINEESPFCGKDVEVKKKENEKRTEGLKSGGDTISVYEIYKDANFEVLPSANVSEESLQVSTSRTESSLQSLQKDANKGSVRHTARRSLSQNSSVSNLSGASQASGTSLPKKSLSSEGLIKFLKSKVSILENELEASSHELTKKSKEFEKLAEIQKRVETQRDQAISKNNLLTEKMSKLEAKLEEIERTLKEREAEFTVTSRETESLKREFRLLTQTNMNLEKRVYRANEELENVRNNLTSAREADRELQETLRKEKDEHARQLKTLKKQRTDLLNAYKKQLYLADNLKRQTVCLEQARLISFAEKEFTKVLEWNTKN